MGIVGEDDMDYRKIYDLFIADRRTKELSLVGYSERHHIFPKVFGGGDNPENLIRLSPADHYFAHEMLARIYGGPMWSALHFMSGGNVNSAKGHVVRRWQYACSKRHYSEHQRARTTVRMNSVEVKNKISEQFKALWKTPEYREKIIKGLSSRVRTTESRAKTGKLSKMNWSNPEIREKMIRGLSDSRKGMRLTDSHKAAISTGSRGKPKSAVHTAKVAAKKAAYREYWEQFGRGCPGRGYCNVDKTHFNQWLANRS